MERSRKNHGSSPIPEAQRFDLGRLERWLVAQVDGFRGPLTLEKFNGGQSNPTYRVITPLRAYVLRRKPPGLLLPGAHAVEREYRVTEALYRAGFPVARPLAFCADTEVIGSEFFVMEFVDGRLFWEADFPEVPTVERPLYFNAMNETIARLHSLDPESLSLAGYGRSANYFDRQIGRWSAQYFADEEAGRLPAMEALIGWLRRNMPAQEERSRIIHGDFRCDNLIFHPCEPRVIAVLDWELSTLGQPLADFAYHLMMYRMPPGMIAGLADLDLVQLNIPSEEEYVAAYCERTGRGDLQDIDFFVCFGMFRLAAILHGIRGRLARGSAASAHAGGTAALLEPLLQVALAQMGGSARR
jgi:aminoglycoside phosphotransferase (APT) family kinase protein